MEFLYVGGIWGFRAELRREMVFGFWFLVGLGGGVTWGCEEGGHLVSICVFWETFCTNLCAWCVLGCGWGNGVTYLR
jgi:hypothetical protein